MQGIRICILKLKLNLMYRAAGTSSTVIPKYRQSQTLVKKKSIRDITVIEPFQFLAQLNAKIKSN